MRDVQYKPQNSSQDTVDVGNTLEYSIPVHEGTSRMKGRPYIKDGIEGGKSALQKVAEAQLKKGF